MSIAESIARRVDAQMAAKPFKSVIHLFLSSVAARESEADPFIFVLYREVLACIILIAIINLQGHKIQIDRVDYRRFAFLGVCSFVNVVGASLHLSKSICDLSTQNTLYGNCNLNIDYGK